MSENKDDPVLLSTPHRQSSNIPSDGHEHLESSPTPQSANGFHVAVPSLPRSDKEKYKDLSETSLTGDVDIAVEDLDQVVGEYLEKKTLYYFARFRDGIIHKFLAQAFRAEFSDLVRDYEHKKAEGGLAPFDPSASYVHPESRVTTIISINRKKSSVKVSSSFGPRSKQRLGAINIISSDNGQDDSEDEDYSDEDLPRWRMTTRAALAKNKSVKNLPFSPRKTRSRNVFAVDSSDEGSDQESDLLVPTRRSTRVRKSDKQYVPEGDEEVSDSDVSDYGGKHRAPIKSKLRARKKIIRRAAYGHIRNIADLGYDSHSDEETAPLRVHRNLCEKCHRQPAHESLELERKKMNRKRKKGISDFEESDTDEEKMNALGGWVRCLKCPVVAHWRCLAPPQRDEIMKAAREIDQARSDQKDQPISLVEDPTTGALVETQGDKLGEVPLRKALLAYETTEFICGACMKGGSCMGCMQVALEPDATIRSKEAAAGKPSTIAGDGAEEKSAEQDHEAEMAGETGRVISEPPQRKSMRELLFRCLTCKRLAHYRCLPVPSSLSDRFDSVPEHYQSTTKWLCSECFSYSYDLDKIIAWRPYPPHATEPRSPANEPTSWKRLLPREYLVKWKDKSYRRVQWVPHMWLVSTHPAMLKKFLENGPRIELLAETCSQEVLEGTSTSMFEITEDDGRDSSTGAEAQTSLLPSGPLPDAELRIPSAWKSVSRVLDVLLWYPERRKLASKTKNKRGGKGKKKTVVESEDELSEDIHGSEARQKLDEEYAAIFKDGEQPPEDLTETLEEYEARTGESMQAQDIDRVVWIFVKWDDLGYEEASWDSPPRIGEFGRLAFEEAFKRFLASHTVTVPILGRKKTAEYDKRPRNEYRRLHVLKDNEQPDLGQCNGLKLMPFQIDGFNWLNNNWWNLQHCILADEMGLGKTVQIVTFIGNIIKNWNAYPVLIVVPNSTITNWVREFERWAPNLRVVPYYGEAKAREVISRFELRHENKASGTTGAKFHVLVTAYQCITNARDFNSVFKIQPRWEVLIVDEGQRLKSDGNVLFKKLNELRTIHRIIMTGTPLNNNIRELFNLMNFLDPGEWDDLESLEKEYAELNEDLIKQLHARLRPYFLRRIKSEVLQLPPKNEVIVPVSMTPLQKEVYRLILSQNVAILASLAQPAASKTGATKPKASVHNILMQLRKCLQHPYLYSRDIEPTGMSQQETHEKLIDASAKLRLLHVMLPRLKARGHRVLLFSQFVIALDIIEDFLNGEGFKYLRLDGSTKQADRQKHMDEFNRAGSDIFIYLLSTRAGGVGINLWSADTVIIFDPDFNPHMDIQAIARSHRYGQTKTCLVFRLMVKASAEERIIQTGKKKMVLDHLIVQKMDDEETAGETLQSILIYGAKALFEDQGDQDISYTEQDIEQLIEKTEKEGEQDEATKDQLSFPFAKIWAADKDTLEEVSDEPPDVDSWAQTLQRVAAEQKQQQTQETTGRGARRRAAATTIFPKQTFGLDDMPETIPKKKGKSSVSDFSSYAGESDSDREVSDYSMALDMEDRALSQRNQDPQPSSEMPLPEESSIKRRDAFVFSPRRKQTFLLSDDDDDGSCGLCGTKHGRGACLMVKTPENLAEYRLLLLTHEDDEPLEDRLRAVKAIDRTLAKRRRLDLISDQPSLGAKESEVKRAKLPIFDLQDRLIARKTVKSSLAASSTQLQANVTKVRVPQPSATFFDKTGSSKMQVQIALADDGPGLVGGKRPSPFGDHQSGNKKPRQVDTPSCIICGSVPAHLIKDCPIVLAGPKSISAEIRRLEQVPSMNSAVDVLRAILRKQKLKEMTKMRQ